MLQFYLLVQQIIVEGRELRVPSASQLNVWTNIPEDSLLLATFELTWELGMVWSFWVPVAPHPNF